MNVKKIIARDGLVVFIIVIILIAVAIIEPIYIQHRYNKYPEIKTTLAKLDAFYGTARFKELPSGVAFDNFYPLQERLLIGYWSTNKAFLNKIHDYLDGRNNVIPDCSIDNFNLKPIPINGLSPLLILGYLLYLLIRFITWAIRTLKEK